MSEIPDDLTQLVAKLEFHIRVYHGKPNEKDMQDVERLVETYEQQKDKEC